MKTSKHKNIVSKSLLALLAVGAVSLSSAHATIVWELNPTNTNGNVGSSSQIFFEQGYQITARGYDNNGGVGTAHELFDKSQGPIGSASEHGLGLVGTTDNELQLTAQGAVANFIQLDLSSILKQGFTGGQIEVGSVQAGESFQLFGSNTQGVLGTSLGGVYGSTFDDKFVPIPNFGQFQFISIAAGNADVLPVAFEANITPVPEMSALFPIIGLVTAIGSTHVLRRRKLARSAANRA
jgi:hypothetical protein